MLKDARSISDYCPMTRRLVNVLKRVCNEAVVAQMEVLAGWTE